MIYLKLRNQLEQIDNDRVSSIQDKPFEGDFHPLHMTSDLSWIVSKKHAISAIQKNENVLVTAHTGSGKTVPAIYGIAHSLQENKKIIYTSPNQIPLQSETL